MLTYNANWKVHIQHHPLELDFRRVKEHHTLLHPSQRLKNTCVRQLVLNKLFPLSRVQLYIGMRLTRMPGIHKLTTNNRNPESQD